MCEKSSNPTFACDIFVRWKLFFIWNQEIHYCLVIKLSMIKRNMMLWGTLMYSLQWHAYTRNQLQVWYYHYDCHYYNSQWPFLMSSTQSVVPKHTLFGSISLSWGLKSRKWYWKDSFRSPQGQQCLRTKNFLCHNVCM